MTTPADQATPGQLPPGLFAAARRLVPLLGSVPPGRAKRMLRQLTDSDARAALYLMQIGAAALVEMGESEAAAASPADGIGEHP